MNLVLLVSVRASISRILLTPESRKLQTTYANKSSINFPTCRLLTLKHHQLCYKLHLCTAIVIRMVVYACETWKRTTTIAHRLDGFHLRCSTYNCRHLIHGSTSEEVMRRAGMERLQDIVATRRRKMAGHVLELPERKIRTCMHTAMYWVPEDGRRKRGRPKNTWRRTFKEDLEEMGVSWHGARRIASDRERWRLLVARCSGRNSWNIIALLY